MTEDQLRENVRKALVAYRDHYADALHDQTEYTEDYDHLLVSKTLVESALRILWMD